MRDKSKRDHHGVRGVRIPPERILRAEELFAGTREQAPMSTREIEKRLMEEFKVERRQAQEYLMLARQNLARIAMNNGETPEAMVERAEQMLMDAFFTAKAKSDASAMLQAAQRLAELRGIYKREVQIEASFTGLADALHSVMGEIGADEQTKGIVLEAAKQKDARKRAKKVES